MEVVLNVPVLNALICSLVPLEECFLSGLETSHPGDQEKLPGWAPAGSAPLATIASSSLTSSPLHLRFSFHYSSFPQVFGSDSSPRDWLMVWWWWYSWHFLSLGSLSSGFWQTLLVLQDVVIVCTPLGEKASEILNKPWKRILLFYSISWVLSSVWKAFFGCCYHVCVTLQLSWMPPWVVLVIGAFSWERAELLLKLLKNRDWSREEMSGIIFFPYRKLPLKICTWVKS